MACFSHKFNSKPTLNTFSLHYFTDILQPLRYANKEDIHNSVFYIRNLRHMSEPLGQTKNTNIQKR